MGLNNYEVVISTTTEQRYVIKALSRNDAAFKVANAEPTETVEVKRFVKASRLIEPGEVPAPPEFLLEEEPTLRTNEVVAAEAKRRR